MSTGSAAPLVSVLPWDSPSSSDGAHRFTRMLPSSEVDICHLAQPIQDICQHARRKDRRVWDLWLAFKPRSSEPHGSPFQNGVDVEIMNRSDASVRREGWGSLRFAEKSLSLFEGWLMFLSYLSKGPFSRQVYYYTGPPSRRTWGFFMWWW